MATLPGRPYKVSALYRTHLALGARWAEDGEWRLPEAFADPVAEADRVRQSAGLQDVSAIGKLDVTGREIGRLLPGLSPQDHLSVLRLTREHALVLTAPGRERQVAESLLQALSRAPGCAHLTDVTGALSAFALVGPRAHEVLARLTSLDLRPHAFPDGTCAQGGVATIHAVILREDWGRLPAYRLLVQRELGEYGWGAIRDAGASLGLVPFGRAAERLLRAPHPALSPDWGEDKGEGVKA